MLKIIKDIDICYDGIRLIKFKKGDELDVKSLLPNPEKAKAFHDRLIDLEVAEDIGEKKPEKQEEPKEVESIDSTFAHMKKKELQRFLDDAGIEYESGANKPRLVDLAREVAVQSESE